MLYTVLVTVEVSADSVDEAYRFIRHGAKHAAVVLLDQEVIDQTRETEDEEPERAPRKLTRHERLQALADSGCDTWQEKRGER